MCDYDYGSAGYLKYRTVSTICLTTPLIPHSLSMGSWDGVARRFFSPQPRSTNHYELLGADEELPTRRASPTSRRRSFSPRWLRTGFFACFHLLTFRRVLIFILSIPVLLCMGVLWSGIPPNYESIREFERHLPQHHNVSLTSVEGEHAMYLRFPEHLWGHGLNNILQEIILMSQLAYLSNRSYVFEDYTWRHTPFPYAIYDFALRPARIPINAFISGPSAGGPMPAPRAVSSEYWETICPPAKRMKISSKDAPNIEEGEELMAWWVEKLKSTSEECVEVGNEPPLFSWFLFGSDRVLSLWPTLSESPIVKNFAWSPLVTAGLARNLALLTSSPSSPSIDRSDSHDLGIRVDTFRGLVAVHLRRGDYVRHCPRLAQWGATYMGFNQFPSLPDKFSPPTFGTLNSLDGRTQYYMSHCWPDVPDIISKLAEVRAENPGLRRVFVLTNGWGWWIDGLRKALQEDGWEDVRSSLDVRVDAEQKYVAMAIDMAIAERSEVFIGNGFSSLSSNIVMLRMAKEMDPRSNRFW
ncbi:hypothetical protein EW145_g6178 [Phellinidium pouzarii]|uniref:O-fucosyltransferase family protein n=1 Tax=Phellinidium pouzarii TaxID=167371 RepID=A0A4S4KXI4_9AGAM|nr:hypothetical protein EW145_g6178 [Phellinidium pouzarii]